MAEGSPSTEIVADGQKDFAKRPNLDCMMVEAPGRQRFQKVHLWTTFNGGITTDTYNPDKHGPDKAGKCPILPTELELIPATQSTREFLEVGLVFGDDPQKNMPKGAAGNKARAAEKKGKEIQRRPDVMMRAFTPVTDYIQEQNKVYIGCQPKGGRLNHFLGKADCVFFYSEFHEGIPDRTPKKQISSMILQKTREAAARNKTTEKPTVAVVTPDQPSKKRTAHPIVVTQSEHHSSMLLFQLGLYEMTKDAKYINTMAKILEGKLPDLKYGPDTSTGGITCFMDFTKELAWDKAELLSKELKANYPNMSPCVVLIKMIHAVLCEPRQSLPGNGNWAGKEPLGNELMVSGFGFFMELVHEKAVGPDAKDGSYKSHVVFLEVHNALQATEIFVRHAQGSWTPFNAVPKGGGKVSVKDLCRSMSDVCDVLRDVIRFSKQSMAEVAKHHGGLVKSTSFKEVMKQVGEAIDTSSLQTRFEQISALHAATLAHNNIQGSETLQYVVDDLTKVLLITEKSLEEARDGNMDGDGDVGMQ